MAFLFVKDNEGWGAYRLAPGTVHTLTPGRGKGPKLVAKPQPNAPVPRAGVTGVTGEHVLLLVPTEDAGQPGAWAVAGAPGTFAASGLRCETGLHLLHDREQLDYYGESVFFSTEATAEVTIFGGDHPLVCPRCKTSIVDGDASVVCVHCGLRYHHTDNRKCFDYGPTCVTCEGLTEIGAPPTWMPADENGTLG